MELRQIRISLVQLKAFACVAFSAFILVSCQFSGNINSELASGDSAGDFGTSIPSVSIGTPSSVIGSSTTVFNFPLTIKFAESVDLSLSMITISGAGSTGCVASISGSGLSSRSINVTQCSGNGLMSIAIAAGAGVNKNGVSPSVFSVIPATIDSVPPGLTISAPSSAYVSSSTSTSFTVSFSDAASVSLSSSAILFSGASTGCVATVSGTGNSSRTLLVTGCTSNGAAQFTIVAAVAIDTVGNLSVVSSASPTFTIDNTAPSYSAVPTHAATDSSLVQSPVVTFTSNGTDVGGSGIQKYQYAIGTKSRAIAGNDTDVQLTNIKTWTDVSGATFTSSGLTLTGSTSYYINLRAVDNVGNPSLPLISSAGWTAGNLTLTVTAAYPTNGANWNDYVLANGLDLYSANDTACVGTELGYWNCIHGGEKRKVALTGVASCAGLTMSDSLGAFDWICKVVGPTATFFSKGFKAGKGLTDLVNATSWKNISVTLAGSQIGTSASTTWWSNTVAALPDNSSTPTLVLDGTDDDGAGPDAVFTTGTILTYSSSRNTAGYRLSLDKLSLVKIGNVALTYNGLAGAQCVYGSSVVCFATKFNWIEANLIGAVETVTIHGGKMGRVHNSVIGPAGTYSGIMFNLAYAIHVSDSVMYGNPEAGFWIGYPSASHYNSFEDIRIVGGGGTYASVTVYSGSSNNRFKNILIQYRSGYGVSICSNCNNNKFEKIRISSIAGGGISVSGANNVFSQVVTNNNSVYGVAVGGSVGSTINNQIVGLTIAANATAGTIGGLYFSDSQGTTAHNVLTQGNYESGVRLVGTPNNSTLGHLVVGATSSPTSYPNIIVAATATSAKFNGNFIIEGRGPTDCSVASGGTGITDSTCAASGVSSFSKFTSGVIDLSTQFQYFINADDPANTYDTAGAATFPGSWATLDWLNFSNSWRTWGKAGQGQWTTGTGKIMDWRLLQSATVLRNSTKDFTSPNETFVAGSACPSSIHGNQVATNQTSQTYLLNAFEILFDNSGDDDALCESGEACLYAPNYGAYQGDGDYSGYTCVFQDGTVSGITMYAHPINGYSANPTVIANGGASATNSTSVILSMNPASFVATQMCITNTVSCGTANNCDGGAWETFNYTKAWTLPNTSASNTIYVKYRDAALAESSCASVTMTHATVVPTLASATISNTSPTGSTTYNLTFGSTSGSPAHYCILENNTSNSTCAWNNFPLPTSFIVSSTNNAKVLSVWVRTAAGNISSRVDSNSVVLDNTGPVWANSVTKTGNTASLTVGPDFTYSNNATDSPAGVLKYQYAVGTGTAGSAASDIKAWTDAPASPVSGYAIAATSKVVSYYVNMRTVDNLNNMTSNSSTPWKVLLSVAAAYPTNGSNWNDYVKNDGADIYSATDTACVGTENYYSSCLHGGEMRKVVIDGLASCTGLTMTDSLGVFSWSCAVKAGIATFFSTGVKTTTGLANLVSTSAWNSLSVSLAGTAAGSSASGIWWTNVVTPLPLNDTGSFIVIDGIDDDTTGPDAVYTAGTVFTMATSLGTKGYNFNLDKLAVVTLPGVTMTYNGTVAATVSYQGGETASANRSAMLSVGSQKFLWFEVSLDGAGIPNIMLLLAVTTHSRVHRTTIVNPFDDTVWLNNSAHSNYLTQINVTGGCCGLWIGWDSPSNYNTVDGLVTSGNWDKGFTTYTGGYGVFRNITVANSTGHGLNIVTSNNIFTNVNTSNNGGDGIYVNSPENFFTNVLSVGNAGSGVTLSNAATGSKGSFLSGVTTAFNSVGGLNVNHPVEVSNLLALKNGVGVNVSNTASFHGLASLGSTTQDIVQDNVGGAPPVILGNLLVTNNTTSCTETNGTSVNGVTPNTCLPRGTSTGSVFYQGSILASNFVGALVSADSANTSDTNGAATFPVTPLTFDWNRFDNPFRLWGVWGTAGRWTAGTGSILDFKLLATGTKIYKNTLSVSTDNGNFTAGAACPAAVNGNVTSSYDFTGIAISPARTYLTHAVEIIDPVMTGYSASGNHNGMCESGDACLYLPNFGRYQGEGTLGLCTFTNGPVTGVTMYGYSTNGI